MDALETPAVLPFWSAPTSYLNFCEEDYALTRYIAEFINTLSSLSYVAYGIYGLSSNGKRPQSASRVASYCGLMGVGICSAGYHMTLKYHTQMLDELSMHLLATPILYRLLTLGAGPYYTKVVGVTLLVLFIIVMTTHMLMDEFLLHATTFGLAVYLIASRIWQIIPQRVPDSQIRKKLQTLTKFGCVNFLGGYFLWLVDEWACGLLTKMRHSVGMPVAFFLELHGWWHILTAIGGYIAVAIVDVLTSTSGEVVEDPIPSFAWPIPQALQILSGTARVKNHGK
ncbi:hypothetical protein GQ602_006947 [Ophiocordyceps camponoti-floridani]|uniref:Alkaline phytoceramidase n=1 Tax=Ophiocordyceps camponoti-floridani TaxID=2030778 RepID=A0A8H4Q0D1_9HYPO|nr:hypothetical protein GQ602_006947 [Ophiocordyceps camponoti-floridani]